MNIAILISVSKYTDSRNDLPACANDFALIDSILTHSGKFTEVLRLESDTTSSKVKSELARFVKEQKGKNIDELFFFYTGHGELHLDDFYFVLSDFDEDRRQQTALSNAELDSMMRSLSPSLTIKLVDACHSGVPYVKNANILEKSLDVSKGKYDRCYFMFSSQKEQPSFQDAHLSDFTESFAQSISQRSQDTIRYKDIADFISDEFQHKGQQTPAFVLQSDLTDVFCTITPDMRKDLKGQLQRASTSPASKKDDSETTTTTTPPPEPPRSLHDLVALEAEKFCTENEAMTALEELKAGLAQHTLDGDLSDLYELDTEVKSDFYGVPKMDSIAAWLDKNENDYFVEVQYRDEEYEDTVKVPKVYSGLMGSHLRTLASLQGNDYEYRTVTRTRKVPDGIRLTATPPFCAIEVRLTPKYENLPWWTEFIVLAFSKSTARLFYALVRLKEQNWSERVLVGEIKWKTKEVSLKDRDKLLESAKTMLDELGDTVSKGLRDKYGLHDDDSIDNDDPHDTGE